MSARLRSVLVAVLLAGCLSVAAVPGRADAATCSTTSTAVSTVAATRRPVILVHGWTGNKSSLSGLGKVLAADFGGQIQVLYFDYGSQSTTWAGDAAVSGCLSTYIAAVSKAYGGDGKVILIGHSMGGLASLYAATGAVRNEIGGLITLDTPYLGSPFGGTSLAATWQSAQQIIHSIQAPPVGADAQLCLGQHSSGQALPKGCAYDLPPYLPAAVPVTAIAGDVTVRRMMGPIHLYDIDLDSDGIVPAPSSWGYLQIQSKAAQPAGASITLPTDACTITSDTLETAAEAAEWTKNDLAALAAGAAQIYADRNSLDGLLSGNLTVGLIAYLGAATLAAPCSHIHIYNDTSAQSQVVDALKRDLIQLTPTPKPTPTPTPTKGGGSTSGGSSTSGTFALTINKGRAGDTLLVEQASKCPAGVTTSPSNIEQVSVTFVDASGKTHSGVSPGTNVNTDGSWVDDPSLTIPYYAVQIASNGSVVVEGAAATGAGKVEVQCVLRTGGSVKVMQTFAPQSFTVSAGPRRFTVSPTTVAVGGTVRITPTDACLPSKTGDIQGEIAKSDGGGGVVIRPVLSDNGTWSPVDVAIPSTLAPGTYVVGMACETVTSTSLGTPFSYNYNDVVLTVTQ